MPRVLVIDDDSVIGTLVTVILQRQGFDVAVEEDGEAGVRAACAQRPDVVLVDSTMPGMSGADVVSALRAAPETSGVPVVMMSANWSAVEGSGADGGLRKPFDPPDLVAAVRRHVPA
jgi:DNA-binding response OmpR family regulator